MAVNTEQQKAIMHCRGPEMVLAGPGSGKTTVITQRIKTLIENYHIPPTNILVVTFTRAAAGEMKTRFERLAGGSAEGVLFGTFHAVFYRILREACNFSQNAVVSAAEQSAWLRTFLYSQKEAFPEEAGFPEELAQEIGSVKMRGLPVEGYEAKCCSTALFGAAYAYYRTRLRSEKRLDFEDMAQLCLQLFRTRPGVLKYWQERFRYILVDEFQDISGTQYEVLKLLAAPENNLFIVGDDDQSIYRFRGASPGFMRQFAEDYPNAEKVILKQCYRCSPQILRSAERLIRHNTQRFKKKLQSEAEDGPKPAFCCFENQSAQTDYILRELERLHRQGVPWEEMAVLFRTGFHEQGMTAALLRRDIPFHMNERVQDIHSHWIAQDLFAYLRLGKGGRSRADFLQIANKPLRYLSRDAFPDETVSIFSLREYYRGKEWMLDRVDRLDYDLRVLRQLRPFAAVEYIRREMGYENYVSEKAAGQNRSPQDLMNVLDYLQEESAGFDSLRAWQEDIADRREKLRRLQEKKEKSGVEISTMHGAKGLEYDAVFIPDVNEEIVPHRRSMDDEGLEEERRLLYVAMTRARRFLTVSWLANRRASKELPSRFIIECLGNEKVQIF